MLSILYGRAGTGKTDKIMREIAQRMSQGEAGMLLIVPEQYSHDAERQLCAVCGDSLSLFAEVLSFTRLCTRVFDETGTASPRGGDRQGKAMKVLDRSGQILVMYKALESVLPNLRVFGAKVTRTEMIESLLAAVREFRSMRITPQKLEELAAGTGAPLSDKLRDFALISEAYDALLEVYGGDSAERLELLAEKIGESSAGAGHIYFDGFNDFTAQEMRVIEEMLGKGADVTVCLTCELDEDETAPGYEEIFRIPLRTAAQLGRLTSQIEYIRAEEDEEAAAKEYKPELAFIEKHIFDDTPPVFRAHTPAEHPVSVYAAPAQYTECEYAAAVIWDRVRKGCRWCDIGVMARDFPGYEAMCEQVFQRYGIPYFTSGSTDIHSKSPIALIDAALEIAVMGWEYKSVFRYLKTGLPGLSADETAMLENYAVKWNIRGSMWLRGWVMPPSGYRTGFYSRKSKDDDEKLLKELNMLRARVTQPLAKLSEGLRTAVSADASGGKKKAAGNGELSAQAMLRVLYTFLTDIGLPERLRDKAAQFGRQGQLRASDEYRQLLNIIIDALDQMFAVLGESKLTPAEFRKLINLVLSQHNVGVIPISLDRVMLGSMAMSRRRDLKCLIILGADDESLPMLSQGSGALSDNERRILSKLEGSIPSGLEERLCREMNMIYSTLTLPRDKLIVMYNTAGGNRPSFIINRLCGMFGIDETVLTPEEYMGAAETPYMELQSRRGTAGAVKREHLSAQAAEKLYGSEIILSASRADMYYSCPYRYFLQNGLKLTARKQAQFDNASLGVYMHYVLEGVIGEVKTSPGFNNVDDDMIKALVRKYSDAFVSEVLLDFEGKNTRFKYLFKRCERNALHVVRDSIDELKCSKFTPYEFEMNLSQLSDKLSGFADRVDVYEEDGKLYVRIIDYKTRRRAYDFDLCDVVHGRDMQMLLYLFAIEKYGAEKLGAEPVPAGILYTPARDVIVSAPRNSDDEGIEKLRQRDMRRSGLILNAPNIIRAMESGENKRFLPVKKSKTGAFEGDSLVSGSQMKALGRYVEGKMTRAAEEIRGGVNDCTPYYKSESDSACTYCDYSAVCRFDEQMGDRQRFAAKMKQEDVWKHIYSGVQYDKR